MDESERHIHDLKTQVAVLIERITGLERARELQADELARRLVELNHAAQKATQDKAEYVGIKTYEQFVAETRVSREEIARQSGELLTRSAFEQSQRDLTTWKEQVAESIAEGRGRSSVVSGIVGTIAALGTSILLHFWK